MIFETKTFEIIQDHARSAAELSHMIDRPDTTYYFNRLIVDKKLRGQGLSIKLMNQVVEWADTEKIKILLEINPYGDLGYLQLAQFYMRFGFEWEDKEHNLMMRKVKE